jgi:hypothetical protein
MTSAVMKLVDHPWAMLALALVFLLVVVELGYRLGLASEANAQEDVREQLVATRDAIGLLLSLLLGFTLAMALPRYDDRKKLLVDEANAIGTTALRAQTLPQPLRAKTLALLAEYVDARVQYSTSELNGPGFQQSLARTKQLQNQLWQAGVAAAQQKPDSVTALFERSLNEAFDLNEKRLATLENRVPVAIWILLGLVGMLSCLMIGVTQRRRFWLVWVVSPLTIAIVLALIADLDAPRTGLIQIGQQSLRRVQQDLKSGSELPGLQNSPNQAP